MTCGSACARRRCRFSAGARDSSISTTTDGKTFSSPTATSTRRWTATTGARRGRSGRCCSANRDGKRFDELPAATGSGLAVVKSARGAAFGDLDNDGRVDVVVNNQDHGPTLLRNVAPAGHWISVALAGDARGPRDAIGAVVTVEAGARRWRRDVVSGSSYCSQSDLRAHFGLGETSRVDRIVVRWPDGAREAFTVPGVDRIVTLTKGRGVVRSAGR